MANRVAIYSIIVLFVSMYAGNIILNFFGISIATLRVAGGDCFVRGRLVGIECSEPGRFRRSAETEESARALFDGVLSLYFAFDDGAGGNFGGRGDRCVAREQHW